MELCAQSHEGLCKNFFLYSSQGEAWGLLNPSVGEPHSQMAAALAVYVERGSGPMWSLLCDPGRGLCLRSCPGKARCGLGLVS